MFNFYPTDSEWLTWPEYCQARYVVSSTGRTSKWAYTFQPAKIETWQKALGSCWGLLHHQCAGAAHLSRAKAATSASDKRFKLSLAEDELSLARSECRSDNPFSATLDTTLAMVLAEKGDTSGGLDVLDSAMQNNPTYDGAYIAKSILLSRAGKKSEARDVLLKGEDAISGGTAELHNALGLSYLSTKEYEKARDHARRAYSLGYQLPGLRNKLARAGYPL